MIVLTTYLTAHRIEIVDKHAFSDEDPFTAAEHQLSRELAGDSTLSSKIIKDTANSPHKRVYFYQCQ